MRVRSLFLRWQFIAVLVLPLWVFVGWGVFGPDGWPFIVVVFVCPVLAVALLVIALLNMARVSVRRGKMLSWLDVSLLGVWHATLVVIGFYGPANSWLILLSVALGLTTFWASAWQLATDASRRVSETLQAPAAAFSRSSTGGAARRPRPTTREGEPIIVVRESDR